MKNCRTHAIASWIFQLIAAAIPAQGEDLLRAMSTVAHTARLGQRSLGLRVSAALGRWARWEFRPAWLFHRPLAD